MTTTNYILPYNFAKQLQQLGVSDSTMFHYLEAPGVEPKLIPAYELNEYEVHVVSAFTAPELAKFLPLYLFLPRVIADGERPWKLLFYRENLEWVTEYIGPDGKSFHAESDTNEVVSRAKMIIYLRTHDIVEK